MNENMERYIGSIESLNSQKVIKHVFKKMNADDIENCNLMQMEQLIISATPNSPKEIITMVITAKIKKKISGSHVLEINPSKNACV